MNEPRPVELTEDRVPLEQIEETIDDLVDLYGGEITTKREREVAFTLPLRRGIRGTALDRGFRGRLAKVSHG